MSSTALSRHSISFLTFVGFEIVSLRSTSNPLVTIESGRDDYARHEGPFLVSCECYQTEPKLVSSLSCVQKSETFRVEGPRNWSGYRSYISVLSVDRSTDFRYSCRTIIIDKIYLNQNSDFGTHSRSFIGVLLQMLRTEQDCIIFIISPARNTSRIITVNGYAVSSVCPYAVLSDVLNLSIVIVESRGVHGVTN